MFYVILGSLFAVWLYFALKCVNPWKTHLIIGKKGSGKSSDMVYQAKKYLGKKCLYWDQQQHKFIREPFKVYCNVELGLPGIRIFNPLNLGSCVPEPVSVVLIDEVNLIWDNRNFKNLSKETQEYFRLQRKLRNIGYYYTQTFDVDKKLRSLCDSMFLCQNFLVIFSIIRRISKTVTIKESALDADSQVVDQLRFVPFFIPGAFKIRFLPAYFKYHNSYEGNNRPFISYTETTS